MTFDYNSQPKEVVTECNLCKGLNLSQRKMKDRYGHDIEQARCDSCGLRFLSPRMTAEAYTDFYRQGHYRTLLSEFYGRPITAESIEEEQEEYADHLITLLREHLDGVPAETLLDVGGSTGVVAEIIAEEFGLDAVVLEPSEAEADRAEERGLSVIRGTVENLVVADRFDVVLVCQTIDHLLDIKRSLRTIHSSMNDGGMLFIDVVLNGPVKIDHPYDLDHCAMLFYLVGTGFTVLTSGPVGDGLHYYFVCGKSCWQAH